MCGRRRYELQGDRTQCVRLVGIEPVDQAVQILVVVMRFGGHMDQCTAATSDIRASECQDGRHGDVLTADPEANELLASDPLALLVGMLLDQQVPMEKAFGGPQGAVGAVRRAGDRGCGSGRADRIWTDGDPDGATVLMRLQNLPGFGEQKARIFLALLGKQYGVQPAGWRAAAGPTARMVRTPRC